MKDWRKYEQLAIFLLNQFAQEFGLEFVEDKQRIQGSISGTKWEIDGKGIIENDAGFIIIECKRYTKSRINQKTVGELAFQIIDTGAKGGILVSPIGFQKGAKKVGAGSNIIEVTLSENSTTKDFVIGFLGKILANLTGEMRPTGSLSIRIFRKDGTIEDIGEV